MTYVGRTLEDVALAMMALQLARMWWRLNRRWVKGWWQRTRDRPPAHPASSQITEGLPVLGTTPQAVR
jgi:hypothetical protein